MRKTVSCYVFQYTDKRGGYYVWRGECRSYPVEHRIGDIEDAHFISDEEYDFRVKNGNLKPPDDACGNPGEWIEVVVTYETGEDIEVSMYDLGYEDGDQGDYGASLREKS